MGIYQSYRDKYTAILYNVQSRIGSVYTSTLRCKHRSLLFTGAILAICVLARLVWAQLYVVRLEWIARLAQHRYSTCLYKKISASKLVVV